MKFRATDYTNYNEKLGLYQYAYLHKLLDLLYKLREQYKIYDERLIYWESETGNQAELKGTMYLNINKRIALHEYIFKELWKQKKQKYGKKVKFAV